VVAIPLPHPPEGAEQEDCGPRPHVIRWGGQACSVPVPAAARERFVKRIVAGPGDRLYIRGGDVYLETPGSSRFVRQSEGFARPCGASFECDFPVPITVPPGEWYVLGDNRGDSDDSRLWGSVPAAWILGVVKR
jgi:signal peptidase I